MDTRESTQGYEAASSSGARASEGEYPGTFHVPSWSHVTSRLAPAFDANHVWLALTDGSPLHEAVLARLRLGGVRVVEVRDGERFAALDEFKYAVDPQNASDFAALASELRDRALLPRRVAHLWSLGPRPRRGGGGWRRHEWANAYPNDLGKDFTSLVLLTRALEAHLSELRVHVVSSHIQAVPGDRVVHPEKAVLLGVCRAIRRESPGVECVSVDVADPEAPRDEERLVEQLARELAAEDDEREVVLRGSERLVRRYEEVRLSAQCGAKAWLKTGGTYLVMGGLGRVGLAVSSLLARTARVNLVLVNRTPLPPEEQRDDWVRSHGPEDETRRRIEGLRSLQSSGAEVLTVAADVARTEDMQAAIAEATARFGHIDGVFHAAGAAGVGPGVRDRGIQSAIFDAKMRGALVLDEVLGGSRLDLFVLFSSSRSLAGGSSLSECAADAFLDALAQARALANDDQRTLVIDCGAWRPEADPEADPGLVLEVGIEAVGRVLAGGASRQIVVGEVPRSPEPFAARALRSPPPEGRWRALVPVRRGGGDRLPFICVHGAGGNVLNLREVSRHMDPVQPFFALQASGVDGATPLHESISEMAEAYLAEVREFQPKGPYLLGGYSGGGIVAFEMAQALTALGEHVALLALIDTRHPQMPIRKLNHAMRLARLLDEGSEYIREIVTRRVEHVRRMRKLRVLEKHLDDGRPIPASLRNLHHHRHFRRASARHELKPWPGRATLFRVEHVKYVYLDGGAAYGWDRHVLGGLEIVTVPGNHDNILVGGNARELAAALDRAISKAQNA